jgi:hypothetical protein
MFALVTLVIAAWSCPPADSVCPYDHSDGLDVRSVLLVCACCAHTAGKSHVSGHLTASVDHMMIAAVRGGNVRDRVGARPPNRGDGL